MTNITFDFQDKIREIKTMHAVGQPPLVGIDTTYFKYLKEANIPYSRLHDVAGKFGGNLYVDIPNIFRDFDADENDPSSYDFVFTDILIAGLMEHDCQPIFRLGVTIENNHRIKSYRIFPPKDEAKWARICEHIIRHYNEGWADGFNYGIVYWEIWNEPDNGPTSESNHMWQGSQEEFFELYRVTSKHLRACFGNTIKIGGYASCGFYSQLSERTRHLGVALGMTKDPTDREVRITYWTTFFLDFIEMVAREKLPLDFFSHHSYEGVENTLIMQRFAERKLAEVGLGDVEIHLNEWNPNPTREERGRAVACANATAMMCAMQDTKMYMMNYYDARIGISVYGGLFNPLTFEPFTTYYGFKAFGKLYKLGTQVRSECDSQDVYVTAATDGDKKGVLIANIGEDTEITTNLDAGMRVYLIDDEHMMEEIECEASQFTLRQNQVIYMEG